MKHLPWLLSALIITGLGCSSAQQETVSDTNTDQVEATAVSDDARLSFTPDEGYRVENASNPGAKLNDGIVSLMYEDRIKHGNFIATAGEDSDWLDFEQAQRVENLSDFRAIKLPDGTFRSYGFDATKGVESGQLTSRSSTDGVTYTDDEGVRYSAQPDDNDSMGVFDFFVDSKGGVVMTYLGDLHGANNLRRAYSTDNGWTFTFEASDILNDAAAQKNGQRGTHVDQKVYAMPDGRFWMITMRQGSVYSFVSDDGGVTWAADGLLLEPSDFSDLGIGSLHDPVMVFLEDGRARIYVTAAEQGGAQNPDVPQHIVSATTAVMF